MEITPHIDPARIERHPLEPFLPQNARLLILGTFPPKKEKWSMDFFYPNRINDFWRIMGIVFHSDKDHFWESERKRFNLSEIKALLTAQHIAMWDTAAAVVRLRDNASDKFLHIVEAIDLNRFFTLRPTIEHVIATGEKAASVVAEITGIELPKIGVPVECEVGGHHFTLHRMPSSSRAYPLSLEKKAEAYATMFRRAGYEV